MLERALQMVNVLREQDLTVPRESLPWVWMEPSGKISWPFGTRYHEPKTVLIPLNPVINFLGLHKENYPQYDKSSA